MSELETQNAELTAQLAKANERVRELEVQTFDVIAAQSIEQAYQIANSFPKDKAILEALSAVKEGATNRLNKFAIEKKIEGIESSIAYAEGKSHFVDVSDLQDYIEQLRKEQKDEQ